MLRRAISLMLLFVLCFVASPIFAQDPTPARPPAILSFRLVDPISPTVVDAESGEMMVHLAWETLNFDEGECCISLERLEYSAWVNQPLPDNAALPVNGDVTFPISHPRSFGAATYRLVLHNQGTREVIYYDQQVLTITLTGDENIAPSIRSFSATAINTIASVSQFDVEIEWAVKDRQPFTNIEFVQVLEDSSTPIIELPRTRLWIDSTGKGLVRPSYPASGTQVALRMQVVDIRTDRILDEFDLSINAPTRPTTSSSPEPIDPEATPEFTSDPNLTRTPAILSFTLVDPITPTMVDAESGEMMVHVAWETINLPENLKCCVAIERLELGNWVYQQMTGFEPLPVTGEIEFPLSHPFNLGPAIYRLRLQSHFDYSVSYDQQILVIPFQTEETVTPSILHFDATTITPTESTTQFDVEVEWAVQNRQPFTNIEFLQVMPDDSTQYVELPREHLWVASAGKGLVRPSYPRNGTEVILRIRVVDVRTGEVLDEFDLSMNAPTKPAS